MNKYVSPSLDFVSTKVVVLTFSSCQLLVCWQEFITKSSIFRFVLEWLCLSHLLFFTCIKFYNETEEYRQDVYTNTWGYKDSRGFRGFGLSVGLSDCSGYFRFNWSSSGWRHVSYLLRVYKSQSLGDNEMSWDRVVKREEETLGIRTVAQVSGSPGFSGWIAVRESARWVYSSFSILEECGEHRINNVVSFYIVFTFLITHERLIREREFERNLGSKLNRNQMNKCGSLN